VSNESGQEEVNVQSFPATGAKWQVSVGGGARPRWGRDGLELFYVSPARKLMSASIGYRPSFEAATPKALFDLDQVTDYAVSRDGRRFLVNRIISDPRADPLTVVLNWQAALKK
jgi:hypothetical protein